jgi:hypothetical protein
VRSHGHYGMMYRGALGRCVRGMVVARERRLPAIIQQPRDALRPAPGQFTAATQHEEGVTASRVAVLPTQRTMTRCAIGAEGKAPVDAMVQVFKYVFGSTALCGLRLAVCPATGAASWPRCLKVKLSLQHHWAGATGRRSRLLPPPGSWAVWTGCEYRESGAETCVLRETHCVGIGWAQARSAATI